MRVYNANVRLKEIYYICNIHSHFYEILIVLEIDAKKMNKYAYLSSSAIKTEKNYTETNFCLPIKLGCEIQIDKRQEHTIDRY